MEFLWDLKLFRMLDYGQPEISYEIISVSAGPFSQKFTDKYHAII